jgi:FkbM family methyltransferase
MNRLFERFGILRKHPDPLRLIVSRILMKSRCSPLLTITREGYRLRFFPSALSAALWINPRERSSEESFLRRNLRIGETAIDVGANIGNVALALAAAVGPSGKVLAIEPHPRIFSYLKANIAHNGFHQIEAVNCALGAENSTVSIKDGRDDDQNSVSTGFDRSAPIVVPLRRLDEVAPPGAISLLKVDVEGFEYFVFSGAESALRRTRMVYFEYVPRFTARFGEEAREPWSPILRAGFHLYQHVEGRFAPLSSPPTSKTMIVAVRDPSDLRR